jgi:hypothetical protein
MHCGRIWAFEEKPERRIGHRSTKSAFTVRPSLIGITSLPLPNGITRILPCDY